MKLKRLTLLPFAFIASTSAETLSFSNCSDTTQNAKIIQSQIINAEQGGEIGLLELYYSFECEGFKPLVKVRGVPSTFDSRVEISLETQDGQFYDSSVVYGIGEGDIVLGPHYSIGPSTSYYQYKYPSPDIVNHFDNAKFTARVKMKLGKYTTYEGNGNVSGKAPFFALTQKASGETFAVNAYNKSNGSNIFMYEFNSVDTDQQWIWSGDRLRLRNTIQCLNAYQPSSGSNVNIWECDASDGDQSFYLSYGSLVEARRSGFCLNSYNTSRSSNLNLWSCSLEDSDQSFSQTLTK